MTAKPVVVGVDGSEEPFRAAEWAASTSTRMPPARPSTPSQTRVA